GIRAFHVTGVQTCALPILFAEAPPARYLADAYRGGQALLAKNTAYDSPYPPGFWQKARTEQRGVASYDPAKAADGYTLYTSGERSEERRVGKEWRSGWTRW